MTEADWTLKLRGTASHVNRAHEPHGGRLPPMATNLLIQAHNLFIKTNKNQTSEQTNKKPKPLPFFEVMLKGCNTVCFMAYILFTHLSKICITDWS